MKVLFISNIIPPYRIPLFDILNRNDKYDFKFIFCTENEGNRNWNNEGIHFNPLFLKSEMKKSGDGFNYIHFDINVLKEIKLINPDVVIITGLYPTMIITFIYALFHRKKIIYMTDGNLDSENDLKNIKKILRRVVFRFIDRFVGASKKSLDLFSHYKIDRSKCFQSCLCVENDLFTNDKKFQEREIDILFCGQLHERKLPFFFYNVIKKLNTKLNVTIIGDGPEKYRLLHLFDESGIIYNYSGSVEYKEIMSYYSNSKLLFFSTRLDAWGLVANESLASGTPVITSCFAGSANELVKNNINGFILKLDEDLWVTKINELLSDEILWNSFSKNAIKSVENYNYFEASQGIINALDSL